MHADSEVFRNFAEQEAQQHMKTGIVQHHCKPEPEKNLAPIEAAIRQATEQEAQHSRGDSASSNSQTSTND